MLPYFQKSHHWLLEQENKTGFIVVTGPTASGKTGYSIELAKYLKTEGIDAEIINADSRQIYTDIPILTAVPSEEEREGIVHHLFDCITPEKTINVSQWRDMAMEKIEEIHSRGKRVIFCGGTGLWINALTKNFTLGVGPNEEFRKEMSTKTGEELHEILQEKDPEEAGKIPATNKKYIIRALEICEEKGKKTDAATMLSPPYPSFIIATTHPREILYNRINARNKLMFEQGTLEEVRQFLEKYPNIPESDSAFIAHGVPEIIQYFAGEMTLERVQEKMTQNTRNYAKRQLTWWRRDDRVHWVDMNINSKMNISDEQY